MLLVYLIICHRFSLLSASLQLPYEEGLFVRLAGPAPTLCSAPDFAVLSLDDTLLTYS